MTRIVPFLFLLIVSILDPWLTAQARCEYGSCLKRYDEMTFLANHNSYANADDRFPFPNQTYAVTKQLEDGVRALLLDIHEFSDDLFLCHGTCWLGNRRLHRTLDEIGSFMQSHPDQIVTLILENHADQRLIEDAFQKTDLLPLIYYQDAASPWPTLEEMIHANRRLVVFTEEKESQVDWLMPFYRFAWDNRWNNQRVEDFDCSVFRGAGSNHLFLMNHFLGDPLPSRTLAQSANSRDSLLAHINLCWQQHQRQPNFIALDFYQLGDAAEIIRSGQ